MPYGIVKEKTKGLAVVIMERQDMCGECHACELMSGKKQCTLTCKDDVACQVGDRVEITLGTEHFLKATYLMYGIPLLGFVAGLGISLLLTQLLCLKQADLWVTLGAVLGTAVGVIYIKWKDKKSTYHKYLPHVVAKVEAVK